MTRDPHAKREQDERRLTGLKVGAVAITVAGLGVFAGLAAAGTDEGPSRAPGTTSGTSVMPSSAATEAARAAEDDAFFDDQAQGGAVGGYEGYGDGDGDHGHHRGRGHHGPPHAWAARRRSRPTIPGCCSPFAASMARIVRT